jgi:hypothetical protein
MQSSIKISGVRETVKELKRLDPDLLKQLRRDIKNEPGIVDAMSAIKSKVPSISPLPGMVHGGRTRYGKPRVSVSFRPSVRLDTAKQRSIITINTTSPKDAIGFQIIDLVGKGNRGSTPKANAMKSKLGGSASRYVWKSIEGKEPGMRRAALNIINDYANKANVRLKIK